MLTKEIAQTIVHETSQRLNRNINIMDEKGRIIASGNPERIDDIHEGALEVLKSGEALTISAGHKEVWRGTQPGINLPIEFQDEIVGVIGITGNPEEIHEFAGIVKMITELMIQQKFIANQLEWQQRTKEMIVEELLKESPAFNNIERGLSLLGTKLKAPFRVHVVQLSDRAMTNQTLIQKVESMIGERSGFACFININRLFFVFSGLGEQEAVNTLNRIYKELKQLNFTFRLSFGMPFDALENFSQAYSDCDLALKITNEQEDFVSFAEIEPRALIHTIEPARAGRFTDRVFTKTVAKYADTLQAFFEHNQNIQQTADELFIHRNTLIYRLTKIQEETGYDPKNFKDALTLQLALWCTKAQNSEPL
jgi:carbohydrate diacid regulator